MSQRLERLLYWMPRILGIVFVFFLSLFALDVFQEGAGLGRVLTAFLIHLIPAAVALLMLLVAWRWEILGSALYAAAGLYYLGRVLPAHLSWAACIAGPLFLISALFFLSRFLHTKTHSAR